MYKIFLVEDEINLNNLIKSYLEKEKYEVTQFFNGTDALNHTADQADLWILDIMLGDEVSGYDIIKKLRESSSVPVIFTSARDQDLDKIVGLEMGSDDYITKPYSPKELVLRVNNIIKRAYTSQTEVVNYDKYVIDLDKRIIKLDDKEINLTTLEFDLLIMFLKNRQKSFSRNQILEKVWGDSYFGSDRVVDDLVRRLRKKLPKLRLATIYGYGYRLL